MNVTKNTRSTFNAAILEAIEYLDSDAEMTNPVIYAREDEGEDEMVFEFGSEIHLQGDAEGESIVWFHVEGDSFGELSGDHKADADGIEANCFEEAVGSIEDDLQVIEDHKN